MDAQEALALAKLSDEHIALARKYAVARAKAGTAEVNLKILLAEKALKLIRASKKNVGVEMAILMFCEDNELARAFYREFLTEEAKYKSLEKLIEAIDKKLSMNQSVMRFFRQND